MGRDPRYDVLFEPVRIGPVQAPNRFYQVPHCSGMGYAYPNASAAMRAVKAEGGWGVVSTEVVEIHWTTDLQPSPFGRLWEDSDIPKQARMVEGVHANGSLAAVQLAHLGLASRNFFSRAPILGPTSLRSHAAGIPIQSKMMDREDIREFRNWHRAAALRARKAGFDIVYVYAAHTGPLLRNFLSRRYNTRTDEYGGSLQNRVRLLREILLETKEAVGERCAIALRFSVDDLLGDVGMTCHGEGREIVEMLAELPDVWDVNIAGWPNDSMTARFAAEGFQERYVSFVKQVTTKPVVGVGRFTSPETMLSQVRRGVLDFIGAARPSIADPFLPRKIAEGRLDDIRECIGCNICVSAERTGVPIRCTQNPTMGEEWRRKWHPERIEPKASGRRVLVVGAGPAGLECATALGKRGYQVALAERGRDLGGRLIGESRLPGLATWIRVRDYRVQALERLPNVEVFRESVMNVEETLELGYEHVVVATGATWRRDGVGPTVLNPVPGTGGARVLTPDDIFGGAEVVGPVLVYDDDHYYMANALCELFRGRSMQATLITPANEIAGWTVQTLEQHKIQASLVRSGVTIRTGLALDGVAEGEAAFACVYTGKIERIAFGSLVLVTARHPNDALYRALSARRAELADRGITIQRIGDCVAPSIVAAAVYSGHEAARGLDLVANDSAPFRREETPLWDMSALGKKAELRRPALAMDRL